MAKFQSPLLGYNNNVRHKGRVFHIQTEDSGVHHPHIITHLFMDGGRILKSVKKSYAEHVGSDGMSELVRQMMKEQHKAMFIALRDGQFDHIVDPSVQAAPKPAPPAASPPPATATATASAAPPPLPPLRPVSVPPVPAPAVRPAPPPQTAAAKIASTPRLVLAIEPEDAPQTAPDLKELTLDFDALERDAHDSGRGGSSSLFHAMDLPPPPKNLFTKERGTGAYRAVEEEPLRDPRREAPDAPSVGRAPSRAPASEGRDAPARPAAIFGAAPKPVLQSIFSDELVSDKSLDEVILSYLAEDLEPPRRK